MVFRYFVEVLIIGKFENKKLTTNNNSRVTFIHEPNLHIHEIAFIPLYSTKPSTHHMAYGFHGYIYVHVWILHSDQNLKFTIEESFFKLLELILQNIVRGQCFSFNILM
jgi:hypothetical protein